MKCPFCGKRLKADYPEGWYNCNSCGDRFYNDGGNLLTVRQMRAKRNHRTCVVCQQSLEGGEYTAPWEKCVSGHGISVMLSSQNCSFLSIIQSAQ